MTIYQSFSDSSSYGEDNREVSNVIYYPHRHSDRQVVLRVIEGKGEQTSYHTPAVTTIPLDSLKCYEILTKQFESLNVIFENTIAIHPSNYLYGSGNKIVLMGLSNHDKSIELHFSQPIQSFTCHVTGSQQTFISGYDNTNALISQMSTPTANLNTTDTTLPPHYPLTVMGKEIVKITLYCFDGEFIVNDISFF